MKWKFPCRLEPEPRPEEKREKKNLRRFGKYFRTNLHKITRDRRRIFHSISLNCSASSPPTSGSLFCRMQERWKLIYFDRVPELSFSRRKTGYFRARWARLMIHLTAKSMARVFGRNSIWSEGPQFFPPDPVVPCGDKGA
jgi:hypothetical protein